MCPASGRFVRANYGVGRSNGLVCSRAQGKKEKTRSNQDFDQSNVLHARIISPPENDSFRILPPPLISFQSDLGRRADSRWTLPQISSFFFFPRVISELRGPIAAKFCMMLLSMFNFIIPGRNFGGASPKNF